VGQNEGLRACERHHDDLRAVMTDLMSVGRWTAAARLVIDAFFYLGFTEQLTEGALWMTTIRPHLGGADPATRAEFLRRWADVRFDEDSDEIAHEVGADYREAVRLFTQLGRPRDARDTRVRLACHERNVGRPDRSVTLALEVWTEAEADADAASATLGALEASRAALLAGQDDVALMMGAHAVRTARNAALGPLMLGTALYHHAGALVAGGGAAQALALGDEVERLFTHPGRPDKAAYAHKLRGEAFAALGRPDAALTSLARAAEGFAGSQAFHHQIHELALGAADALLASGRTDEAALLHGACQELRLRASYRRNPRHDALLARHAALLGADSRTAALVERGRTLDAATLIRTAGHAN
jgi:hypothetical protein